MIAYCVYVCVSEVPPHPLCCRRGTEAVAQAFSRQPEALVVARMPWKRSHTAHTWECIQKLSSYSQHGVVFVYVAARCCRSAHADVSELTLRHSRRGFGTQLGAPRCIRSACAAPFAGHGHRHGVHVVSSSSVCSHQRPVLAVANSCPPSSCWRKRPSASQLCWPAYGVSLELGASP